MTTLLRINWSYCPACTDGDHGTHVAEYLDDDVAKPCACACGGGQAPMRQGMCARCEKPADGICCSSHRKMLCHRDYRLTHFVELCVEGCTACAAEGLPVRLVRS